MDRVRCEDEEERYNICQASDTIIDELEAQWQAYIHWEQEKQDQLIDSAINILTSSIPFPKVPSDGINSSNSPFPSLPPGYPQSSTVSFNQGCIVDRISQGESVIF